MQPNERSSLDLTGDGGATGGYSVRFDDRVYTDADAKPASPERPPAKERTSSIVSTLRDGHRRRQRAGILKRRENTITTPDAPPIILSDEGLKAGRVSPFINFPLFLSMTVRSIGIIFGDIGTSPLYVLKTIFDGPPSENDVIGAISLIVWSLIVVVSIKYAIFILMADNRGEGGPFALCSLLTGQKSRLKYRTKQFVSIVSILAACLLIGDGALTPAVSILSAFEGLVVAKPSLESWTVRISVILIIVLFLVQRWGSSRIGICFGPIMICWFLILAMIGLWRITTKPVILKAFNPWEAMNYLIRTKATGFFQIGSIFLSVTGLEALYADIGHFGCWPVRFSWFAFVFPSVLLNYLGQGAVLILFPNFIDNPFYHSVPDWAVWPILVLSVLAATIASQAVITGTFTIVSQAVAMGFCVPFSVIHTSRSIISHIYVPVANYFLLGLTLAVTIGFQTSDRITDAYGVTVCSVMVITTVLYMMVMRWSWLKPVWLVVLFGIFLIIDLYTFAAICTTKIDSGGWVAILIAAVIFIFSFSWYYGNIRLRFFLAEHSKSHLLEHLSSRIGMRSFELASTSASNETEEFAEGDDDDDEQSTDDDEDVHHHEESKRRRHHQRKRRRVLSDEKNTISISFIENNSQSIEMKNEETPMFDDRTVITPGVGCFLSQSRKYTPYVFENFVHQMHAHQQILIFLKLEYARLPNIDDDQRLIVRVFSPSIYHITATFGYAETNLNLFNILNLARQFYDVPITADQSKITFFLPNETINVSTRGWQSWIRRWPLYIYSFLKNLYPGMPLNFTSVPENTIQVGIAAEL